MPPNQDNKIYKLADISRFESLDNSSRCSTDFVCNGFIGKMKTGVARWADQAKHNFNRWRTQRVSDSIAKRTMSYPTRGVSEAQQDRVADDLVSTNIDFLEITGRLWEKANQIDKYTKQWLVGGRRINMDKLELLLHEAHTAAFSAYTILTKSRFMHENTM